MDPMICTTKDGVKNVFRDVQVISSIDENQVISLVKEFGVKLKDILVYERVAEALQVEEGGKSAILWHKMTPMKLGVLL